MSQKVTARIFHHIAIVVMNKLATSVALFALLYMESQLPSAKDATRSVEIIHSKLSAPWIFGRPLIKY